MPPFVNPGTPVKATRPVPALLGMGVAFVAWLFLWFAPWPAWLGTNLWLQVGIALAVLVLPGAFLSLLIRRGESIGLPFITSGFVFSHLLLALLGTAGRLAQVPFLYVKHSFMALGLIFLLTGAARIWRSGPAVEQPPPGNGAAGPKALLAFAATYWPLAIVATLAMLMTVQRAVTSDDFAYLAHLTSWQGMPRLNFYDVYYGVDQLESTRFWIVSAPFSQAFLSDLSGVPGLVLLSGYYEPFLALLAVLSVYGLARAAGMSKQAAMLSAALQVAFLALLCVDRQPGAPFFRQLSTDKATAAFILSPVFLRYSIELLGPSKKGSLPAFLLSGLSLSLMHPILAAFSVFVVGAMSVLGIKRDNFKKRILLILLGLVILAPQVGVRLVKHPAQPEVPLGVEGLEGARAIESFITRIENTPFYGFNPAILEMRFPYQERLPAPPALLAWAWLALPFLAAPAAFRGMRDRPLQQYILAATLLVALAGVPYTGWLLGAFVSAWMLERAAWIYPFGISAVFVLLALRDAARLGKSLPGRAVSGNPAMYRRIWQSAGAVGPAALWGLSVLLLLLVMREQGLPDTPRLESATRRYQALAAVGQAIDQRAPGLVTVVGPDNLNDFIPALSWKAKAISFRPEDSAYPYFFTKQEKRARLADRQALFSHQTPPRKRMNIIRKYDIRYILTETSQIGRLKDLLEAYPADFELLDFGRYALVEISGSQ